MEQGEGISQSVSLHTRRYKINERRLILWGGVFFFSLLLSACSSNSSIPVPENYGLYAAAGGKQLGVDVPASTMKPPMATARIWPEAGLLPIGAPPIRTEKIPILPADDNFVKYGNRVERNNTTGGDNECPSRKRR